MSPWKYTLRIDGHAVQHNVVLSESWEVPVWRMQIQAAILVYKRRSQPGSTLLVQTSYCRCDRVSCFNTQRCKTENCKGCRAEDIKITVMRLWTSVHAYY